MKKLLNLIALILISIFNVGAQNYTLTSDTTQFVSYSDSIEIADSLQSDSLKGRWDHLTILADERLDTVLNIHIEENKRSAGLDGYRVQIYTSTRSRNPHEKAKLEREQFLKKYPDYKVHIKFMTPDFYVRIGDFRSRSEALKLLAMIKKDYQDAFIVNDRIDYPD